MAKIKQADNKLRLLDIKLNDRAKRALMIINLIMLGSILIHDGDHIRQAYNWSYSIPISLLVLNLVVYLPTVVAIFLTKTRRFSATIVTAFGGINTGIGFAAIHLLGSSSGLWGVWNDPYKELGVDWLSWVILAEVVMVGILVACAALFWAGSVMQKERDTLEYKTK